MEQETVVNGSSQVKYESTDNIDQDFSSNDTDSAQIKLLNILAS